MTKQYTTVSEFEKWQAYFFMRKAEDEKADYRAASICASIERAFTGKCGKIEDYIVRFKEPVVVAPGAKPPDSKAVWAAALGINLEQSYG